MTGRRTPTAWRSCSSGSASGWPTADRLPIWCSFVPGGWTTRSCLWCPTNRRPASAAGDRCAASGDRVGRRPGAAPAGRHPGSGAGGVRRGPAGGGAGPARRRSGCGGGRVPGGPPGGVDRGVGVGGRRGDGGARHVVGRGVEPAGPVRDAGGGVPGHPGRAGGRGDRPGACPDAHRRAGSTRALPARGGGDAAAGRCSRPHGRATASFGETGGAARRRECGARRLAAAIRDRSVRAHPGEDGMGTLAATMPIPLLEACRAALRGYAEECATPDDVRTLDQRMLDCLADLILRPGAGDVSPVQVQLTLVAGVDTMRGGDEPGELNGQPVPAVLVRELAQTLGLLPNVTDRSRLDPTEISVPVPTDAIPTGPDPAADGAHFPPSSADAAAPPPLPVSASDLARARLAELLALRSTVGTALASVAPSPRAPAWVRRPRRPATGPPPRSSGSCAPVTGAAASPAAAPRRSAATSTTTRSGRPAPPARATCAACAATTTGSATRPRAGPCTACPTAACAGPRPAATCSPPTPRPTAATTNPNRRTPTR